MDSQGRAQHTTQSAEGSAEAGRARRAGTRPQKHARGATLGTGTGCAIAGALPAHILPAKGQGEKGTKHSNISDLSCFTGRVANAVLPADM